VDANGDIQKVRVEPATRSAVATCLKKKKRKKKTLGHIKSTDSHPCPHQIFDGLCSYIFGDKSHVTRLASLVEMVFVITNTHTVYSVELERPAGTNVLFLIK